LDAIADDGPFKGQAMPGVYKYEGKDEMLVNFGQPGKARPDDFTCKEGSDRILITYKRAK
jgi:hypothetical protein